MKLLDPNIEFHNNYEEKLIRTCKYAVSSSMRGVASTFLLRDVGDVTVRQNWAQIFYSIDGAS
jgi:hypothetical protein